MVVLAVVEVTKVELLPAQEQLDKVIMVALVMITPEIQQAEAAAVLVLLVEQLAI